MSAKGAMSEHRRGCLEMPMCRASNNSMAADCSLSSSLGTSTCAVPEDGVMHGAGRS